MYMSKNEGGTYYSRIPLPKALRDQGLPFAIRTSLNTKDRPQAIDRNLALAAHVRALISSVPENVTPRSFHKWIRSEIDRFKAGGFALPPHTTAPTIQEEPIGLPSAGIPLKNALGQFIESKTSEGIQHKSVGQLQVRIGEFVKWAKGRKVDEITPVMAMDYRNALLRKQKLSFKTKSDYLAAIKQFFRWCVTTGFCCRNPFEGITAGKKPTKSRADQARSRWSKQQLAKLFDYLRQKQAHTLKIQDYWVPMLCTYAGLRPSEACQLKTQNINEVEGIWCLKVEAAEEGQQLKTENAYRTVPIHSALIDHGFLDYVEQQRLKATKYLFDDKPSGKDKDWSHNLVCRFQRHLNHAGIVGQGRPTIYGLRHTFVDELQQADVPEHLVAELVGHSKKGITYGRYGKRVCIALLKDKIELLPRDMVPFDNKK